MNKSSYKKGTIILKPNDNINNFYHIESGIVRLYTITKDGRELTFNLYKPDTYFPMIPLITNTPNKYFFESFTNSKLTQIPKNEFLNLLKKSPEMLFDLTRRLLSGIDGLLSVIENLISGKALNKIAAVLMILSKRFGKPNGKSILIDLRLTHQQIAAITGLTRETTSLQMEYLQNSGLISYQKQIITIKNFSGLQNLTEDLNINPSPTAL